MINILNDPHTLGDSNAALARTETESGGETGAWAAWETADTDLTSRDWPQPSCSMQQSASAAAQHHRGKAAETFHKQL